MKRTIMLVLLMVSLSATALALPVKITAPGEAYGHHGACSGWNDCGDAETCAQRACEENGFNTLVSYGESKPCTEFDNCNLFYRGEGVQCGWGNWCGVMGVTDIWCDDPMYDGDYQLVCHEDLPPQDNPPGGDGEVPEFTTIGAGLALIGAGLYAYRKKRN
ncbi:LPXTG cell wall anchor domain-containing protein [Candidatus Woesearchaeota archaeon]|nr:MAG: LPXTG cell wall anchor domain-containing protein [Candidatus Woesearchaeota archaeon]